ncbi:DUF6650 family protein [Streptomyces sp. NPDC088249]|uniref:DUF6650 family protein n=1 Tax=Streptomyces sp. NPDC088249 TaxID=3365843 RepID=UPI003826011F
MKFSEIASRITSFSTPIFGVQWTPPRVDVEVARRVISFLEDRRVLWYAITFEVPAECVNSVQEIRAFLTEILGQGGIAKQLSAPLKQMRSHCHRFLERAEISEDMAGEDGSLRRLFRRRHYLMLDYLFGEAVGEFRAGMGVQVAIIATAYGLDIDDSLAATLPPPS